MKENKDREAYQRDLKSGVLDEYVGKYVAYLDGMLVMDGVDIFYANTERKMIKRLQEYRGNFFVQKVMATREEAAAGNPMLEHRTVRTPRRYRK